MELYSKSYQRILSHDIIRALFKENTHIRNFSPDKLLDLKVRICSQGSNPIDEFPSGGFLLYPFNLPNPIEGFYSTLKKLPVNVRKMNLHNPSHHLRVWKGDVVKVTTT